ncbi:MAG: iron-sulfur cluster assembly scaffold protein [Palaeococcus sp.]|uniref:iron-sulfur cluster assembly scaffold protein n=1 Tax=Palaeococcus sp. (in: euryarchaeotes) TaxID=2820298 RepID=UPI0025F1D33D|nr:iron-sulfur cluster assembly scaffold protein [Palaeococcus sp. (in: euryarchaeotes)]MCD6559754.1 iron-sulfur cluster assembly scaffold protein [Palaeococcus sp. (in: euryarchaeotes)]
MERFDAKNWDEKKRIGYSRKVLQYFLHPKNVGEIDNPSVTAKAGSPACGDMIKLYLKIEDERIVDAKFKSYGCAANIATASILTEMIIGKSVEDVKKIKFKDIVEALGGLPQIKFHCAVLAAEGLKQALAKWDVLQGRRDIDEGFVKLILAAVIDPLTGESVLQGHKYRGTEIMGRQIKIMLNVPRDDPEAEIFEEQIKEAFEGLDVDLRIEFS